MIEVTGDLWTYPADFRVITTNGTVKRNGDAVLGRGCAKQAVVRYPMLPALLGARIATRGNRVHFFSDEELHADRGLFTFPVKHEWMLPADLELIAESVARFQEMLLSSAIYVLPRPGCGNGGLLWEDVRPVVSGLPDNVHVIDFAR